MSETTLSCANCGVTFCMPASLNAQLRENHKTFYCPNGHANHYPAETEKERRIRELEAKVRRLELRLQGREETIAWRDTQIRSLRARLAWARRKAA